MGAAPAGRAGAAGWWSADLRAERVRLQLPVVGDVADLLRADGVVGLDAGIVDRVQAREPGAPVAVHDLAAAADHALARRAVRERRLEALDRVVGARRHALEPERLTGRADRVREHGPVR